jgi:hypothetical protein
MSFEIAMVRASVIARLEFPNFSVLPYRSKRSGKAATRETKAAIQKRRGQDVGRQRQGTAAATCVRQVALSNG